MRTATGAAKPRGAGVGRVGPSALVGWAGRRGASRGRGQQPSQERIFLAHGLVADDGDLAVAWGGHEGDDTAALEEAKDALAGTLNDLLDVVLRGGRRRVEHPALAVAVWAVDAVEKDGVQMRVEPQITVCALNDGHGAGLAGGQAAVSVAPAIPARDRVREDAHHLTEQLSVEREWEAQRKGHGQHELPQRHIGQDKIREVQRSLIHPPAETTGAHRASLAAESAP
jgi:hypothetical protein